MAHSKSAEKRARQNIKHRIANRSRNSEIWSLEKNIREEKDLEKKKKMLEIFFSRIDKAVKANALPKNRASRKKSRLSKAIASTK
ncbi:MAG TPA: 30S ribosomal protein S20 [Victivallales bacterium]|nr:30S ribosomal protein S20 [Victivallales bacterium]